MSKYRPDWMKTMQYVNRNPLNIRHNPNVKWQGGLGLGQRGFEKFYTMSMCYRAAVKILRSYRKRGIVTVKDIIRTWAPPAENNTEAYVKSLLSIMNPRFSEPFVVTADTEIDLRNRELVFHLLYAMTRVETGWNAAAMATVKEKIYTGYDLAVTEPRFF